MKILLVDDERLNRTLLSAMLQPLYTVMVAENGKQALQIAAQSDNRPDLILLDIMMPGIDGFEVCRRLKENEDTANIPIIFVTAMDKIEDESKGFSLGAVDYITKPVSQPIVLARVKTHLQLKHNNDLLLQMASIDALTEIANRRAFDTRLRQEWQRAKRHSSSMAVIMMDLDLFKQYNDHYGHTKGDHCLQQTAYALLEVLQRPGDIVARYGGEEFCALLPETDLTGAEKLGEKLRSSVEKLQIPHAQSHVSNVVTISVGVAAAVPDSLLTSPEQLQELADTRLYQAKKEGRNRMVS